MVVESVESVVLRDFLEWNSAPGIRGVSVELRREALRHSVEEIQFLQVADDEFDDLLRVDQEVQQSISSSPGRVRVYALFCRIARNHSVLRARERVFGLLWGLLPEYESVDMLLKLGLNRDQLFSVLSECEYFVPALMDEDGGAAWYVRP